MYICYIYVTPSFVCGHVRRSSVSITVYSLRTKTPRQLVPQTCLPRWPCRYCSHPTCITLHSLWSSTNDAEPNTTIVSCHDIHAEQHFVIKFQRHNSRRPRLVTRHFKSRRVMPESPRLYRIEWSENNPHGNFNSERIYIIVSAQ